MRAVGTILLRIAIPLVLLTIATPQASAQPWRRHIVDDSSRGADGVRLADVNADGRMDITTGWEEGGVTRAYLNPGPERATQLWPTVTVGRVKSPEDAVFADLDADGAFDVISCCEGKNRTIYVHWAPAEANRYLDASAWKTEALPATAQQQSWMFALPLQMDGQGGIDLVVGSKGSHAAVGWLKSPDNPRDVAKWTYHRLCDAGWIMSIQAHDMDRDGDPDVLFSDRKGAGRGIKWLENPGQIATAADQSWPEHPLDAGDREVMFLAVGDVDNNGHQEVVCAVKGRGMSLITRSKEENGPWSVHEIPWPDDCGTGKGAAICDVDLDGRNDVIFSCENAGGGKSGVRWLSCRQTVTQGVWDDHEISGPTGVKFDRLEVLDLDGDGDLDVLTCEEREINAVFWYENPTRSRAR
jgi:hypothetical protein